MLIVDFNDTDSDSGVGDKGLSLFKTLEELVHRILVDAIFLCSSDHTMCLPGAGLPVGHDAHIEAVEAGGHQVLHLLEEGWLAI